jgi:drug/metabolite transporter (DMT)-like permease
MTVYFVRFLVVAISSTTSCPGAVPRPVRSLITRRLVHAVRPAAAFTGSGAAMGSWRGRDGAWASVQRQYRDPSPLTCHLALLLVQCLFAGMHVTASPALRHIPPFGFCALRLMLALPFLAYLAWGEGGRWFRGVEWLWNIPMGVAIGTAYSLVFVCNARSGAIATAMVQPLMPICTTLLSAALGVERVTLGKAAGLAVATVGTAVTLRVFTNVHLGPSPLDAFLLIMQANSYAVYVVLLTLALKRAKKPDLADDAPSSAPPGPMKYLFVSTAVAEVVIASVGAKGLARDVRWRSLPPIAFAGVLYAGIASSCFAHGINSWAISKVEGILPTTYSGVQVIFTVVFAWIFLGEAVGWDRAAGSAATVAGVYVVSRAKERERRSGAAKGTEGKGGGGDARAPPRTSIDLGATVVLRADDDEERATTPNGSGSVEMAADATSRDDVATKSNQDEEETDGAPLLPETKP